MHVFVGSRLEWLAQGVVQRKRGACDRDDADLWEDIKADPEKERLFSNSMACVEKLSKCLIQQKILR